MRKVSKNDYGYDSVFPRRLRKLMDDNKTTQAVLAEECGVARQAVSQWRDGNTRPDILSLHKIAEFYHVSSDFLLGLTDVSIWDTEMKEVCEYTGLSENAVMAITCPLYGEFIDKDMVNKILESGEFWAITHIFTDAQRNKEILSPNVKKLEEIIKSKLQGKEIPQMYRKALSVVSERGMASSYKQELTECICSMFDKILECKKEFKNEKP
ncbi:MAG: helix-turn-helix transcriptional regulator [Clostridia bacterium]|nr:helix-turn-helix transcriptional regulator [Clostridia bacterium]